MNRIIEGMNVLRHMLGVGSHIPKRQWYLRNYFNSSDGGQDNDVLQWLYSEGLVRKGRPQYWHATKAGGEAIGMTERELIKCFPDNPGTKHAT